MKNAIRYGDCWLMPGSQAHALHQEASSRTGSPAQKDKAKKALGALMKRLDAEADARGDIPYAARASELAPRTHAIG